MYFAIFDLLMSIRDLNVSLSLCEVDYLILFEFCGIQNVSMRNAEKL